MSAPPKSNTFNGGADGVTLTTGNSGGSSGDAFDSVSGSPVFSSAQFHSSPLSMRGVDVVTQTTGNWETLGSLTVPIFIRAYLWISNAPVTQRFYYFRSRTNALASAAHLRVMTGSPVLSAADATLSGFGAEGSIPVNLGSWFRVEARIVHSATVGELQWKLFNTPDSTTATETSANFTGLNLAANCDQAQFGLLVVTPDAPFTFYHDDIAVSTTDWIGPTASAGPGDNPPIGILGRGAGW